jgi:hypothetical protein
MAAAVGMMNRTRKVLVIPIVTQRRKIIRQNSRRTGKRMLLVIFAYLDRAVTVAEEAEEEAAADIAVQSVLVRVTSTRTTAPCVTIASIASNLEATVSVSFMSARAAGRVGTKVTPVATARVNLSAGPLLSWRNWERRSTTATSVILVVAVVAVAVAVAVAVSMVMGVVLCLHLQCNVHTRARFATQGMSLGMGIGMACASASQH